MDSNRNVSTASWRPLIMSFRHFYGVGDRLHTSTRGGAGGSYAPWKLTGRKVCQANLRVIIVGMIQVVPAHLRALMTGT